jgi:16S rRNA (guanine527-N7)-methyltransferase
LRQPTALAGARLVDLGSGAGFPAVPIAIWQEELEVLLVESVRKKAQFIEDAIEKLRLGSRVAVTWGRAEDVGADEAHRGRYDVVTARGVGALKRSVAWAAPFLRHGGHFIAFKGTQVETELITAMPIMDRHGMSLVDVIPLRWGTGNLLVLRYAGR